MCLLSYPPSKTFFKVFHSDYFSGWDENKLQHVLDNCDNDSEAAMPNAFCSDFLTFRGKGKVEGVQVDDFDIRDDLEKIQPGPIDIKGLISPEDVTGVPELPRGVCSGELIAASNATTSAPTTFAGGVLFFKLSKCCKTIQLIHHQVSLPVLPKAEPKRWCW